MSYKPPCARMRNIIAQVGLDRATAALSAPPEPPAPEVPVSKPSFPGIPVPTPIVVVDAGLVKDFTAETVGHVEDEQILIDQMISILEPVSEPVPAPAPDPEPAPAPAPEPTPVVATPVVDKKKSSKKGKKG